MKLLFICSIFAASVANSLGENEKFDLASLFELTVLSQNVHAEAQNIMRIDNNLDPLVFGEDAMKIKDELGRLNTNKILERKEFILLNSQELDKLAGFESLDEFARKIGAKYGFYTALEMIDFGIHRRIQPINDNDSVVL